MLKFFAHDEAFFFAPLRDALSLIIYTQDIYEDLSPVLAEY